MLQGYPVEVTLVRVAEGRFINTIRVQGGQGKPALVLLHGECLCL